MIETLHRLMPEGDPQTVLTRMEVHDQAVQMGLDVRTIISEDREVVIIIDRLNRFLHPGETASLSGDCVWVHVPRRLKFRGG